MVAGTTNEYKKSETWTEETAAAGGPSCRREDNIKIDQQK